MDVTIYLCTLILCGAIIFAAIQIGDALKDILEELKNKEKRNIEGINKRRIK